MPSEYSWCKYETEASFCVREGGHTGPHALQDKGGFFGEAPPAKLTAADPVGCGCDEYPECTHVLYFYMGVKYATGQAGEQGELRARMHKRAVREKVCNLRGLVEASRNGFLDGQPYILTYSDIIVELGEIEAALPAPAPPAPVREGRELCPSCQATDNHPYIDDHGQNMRACGRCMIQWVSAQAPAPSPSSGSGK